MKQTEVTLPDFAPRLAAELTRAAAKFVLAVGALIGFSLVLASI